MRRFRFAIIASVLTATCLALAFLFHHLRLSPPFGLSLGLLLAALLGDHASTVIALRLGAREANPFARWIFTKIGVQKGGLVIMGLFAILIVFPWRHLLPYQQLAVACTYLMVPINNLIVIRRRRRVKHD